MFKKITSYLQSPFPQFLSEKKGWNFLIRLVLIFAVLINILQPYGLTNLHDYHKWMILPGYGLIYVSVYAFNYKVFSYLFPKFYLPESWTIGKEFIILLPFFLETSVVSWIFSSLTILEMKFYNISFFQVSFYNVITAIFTVVIFGLFIEIRYYRSKLAADKATDIAIQPIESTNQLETIQPGLHPQVPFSMGPLDEYLCHEGIKIKIDKIHHIASDRNDMLVYIRNKDQLITIKLSTTLKNLEEKLKDDPRFQRCENSFIINIDEVILWRKKDHGLELKLRDYNYWIPVSGKFLMNIKAIIESNSILKEKKTSRKQTK